MGRIFVVYVEGALENFSVWGGHLALSKISGSTNQGTLGTRFLFQEDACWVRNSNRAVLGFRALPQRKPALIPRTSPILRGRSLP